MSETIRGIHVAGPGELVELIIIDKSVETNEEYRSSWFSPDEEIFRKACGEHGLDSEPIWELCQDLLQKNPQMHTLLIDKQKYLEGLRNGEG